MKTQAVKEVDKLLTEVLPPTSLTSKALATLVVDALGQMAGDVARVIEGSEDHAQAFARRAEVDVARQLYRCAIAFCSAQRAIELARATR